VEVLWLLAHQETRPPPFVLIFNGSGFAWAASWPWRGRPDGRVCGLENIEQPRVASSKKEGPLAPIAAVSRGIAGPPGNCAVESISQRLFDLFTLVLL